MEMLYRITSLEGFLSLLINKRERFVNPIDKWEDTYEGYFLQFLNDEDRLMEIINLLYDRISSRAYKVTCRNIAKLLGCRYDCYGICWSTEKDSDAMWRIYSYDEKAVQLISSEDRIRRMLKGAGKEEKDISIYKVKYDLVSDEQLCDKMINTGVALDAAYFHKREAFSHEKEKRVIIHENRQFEEKTEELTRLVKAQLSPDASKEITRVIEEIVNERYIKKYYNDRDRQKELYMEVQSLPDYIEGVRVHPQAQDWYVDLIQKICKEYGIKYSGKSDLYQKPLSSKKKKR